MEKLNNQKNQDLEKVEKLRKKLKEIWKTNKKLEKNIEKI